jgi:hypothetical protein
MMPRAAIFAFDTKPVVNTTGGRNCLTVVPLRRVSQIRLVKELDKLKQDGKEVRRDS